MCNKTVPKVTGATEARQSAADNGLAQAPMVASAPKARKGEGAALLPMRSVR
jgi:hypothetical protein